MRTVIYGQPKSGTTYAFSLLAEAMSQGGDVVEVFEPRSMDRQSKVFKRRDGMTWPLSDHMLVKVLYADANLRSGWPGDEARAVFHDFDKKIFIVRDPRDRWISGFFYRWFHLHQPLLTDFKRAYRLTLHKEKHPGDIPFHSLLSQDPTAQAAWAEEHKSALDELVIYMDQLRADGWHVMTYEDLVDEKWDDLAKYMGLELRKGHGVRPAFRHVSRSNAHSNWRRWFTVEDLAYYQPIFNDFLTSQGYDATDWQLDPSPELNPSEGSAYMHRLFHHANGPQALNKDLLSQCIARIKRLF